MNPYANVFGTKATPQSEPIPGRDQVANHAGGYVFKMSPWAQLQRFLVLGSVGGTYYAGERDHTKEQMTAIQACLEEDGPRAVRLAVEISDGGRAASNDPAITLVALAAACKSQVTRAAAYAAVPSVCRIPTHLFHFLAMVKATRGWSGGLRRAVRAYYESKDVAGLAYHLVKYQRRDGWSHRDALRLAHCDTSDPVRAALYRYAATQGAGLDARTIGIEGKHRQRSYAAADRALLPPIIGAFEDLKTANPDAELGASQAAYVARMIREHGLTREMLPTQALKRPEVWEALLEDMPMTALIRNLGNMSKVGLLAPMSEAVRKVRAQLGDQDRLRKARVHPLQVLVAMKTYASGEGLRGGGTWEPVQPVVDALDAAFYLSFGAVEPIGTPQLLALDVSSSMTWSNLSGQPITPREASAAMALVTAAVEQNYEIVGLSGRLVPIRISPRMRLSEAVAVVGNAPAGSTDCSLPMLYAAEAGIRVDGFSVYTDNETWAGRIQPVQALQQYRSKHSPTARLAVIGMTSHGFTIADPGDGGMMDFVGFDTATPAALSAFMRGVA